MLIDRLISVPSFVSMIKRGPTSGSGAGAGVAAAGSGLVERLVAEPLRLVLLAGGFVVVGLVPGVVAGGEGDSAVSPLSSFFVVSSTVGVSTTFDFTDVDDDVRLPAGRRVRGEVGDTVALGAGSILSGGAAIGDSSGGAEGVATGVVADVDADATSVTGGSGSGKRAPTDDTRFAPGLVVATDSLLAVSSSATSGPPAMGSNDPPKAKR